MDSCAQLEFCLLFVRRSAPNLSEVEEEQLIVRKVEAGQERFDAVCLFPFLERLKEATNQTEHSRMLALGGKSDEVGKSIMSARSRPHEPRNTRIREASMGNYSFFIINQVKRREEPDAAEIAGQKENRRRLRTWPEIGAGRVRRP